MTFAECWKCGTSVDSRALRYVDHGVVRTICDDCNPDSDQNVIARLRARETALVDALTDCKTVLCESRQGEDLKTLTDVELGKLWTALEEKVDQALAAQSTEG